MECFCEDVCCFRVNESTAVWVQATVTQQKKQQTMFNQVIFAVRVVLDMIRRPLQNRKPSLAKDVWMVNCMTKFKGRTLSHTPLTHLRCFQTFWLIFSGTMSATRLVGGTANWNHITAQIKTSQAGFAAENAPSRTAPLFLLKWTSSKKALAPDRYPIMCAASLSPLHLPL